MFKAMQTENMCRVLVAIFVCFLQVAAEMNVWPIPTGKEEGRGDYLALASGFKVHYEGFSVVAMAGAERYTTWINAKQGKAPKAAAGLGALRVHVADDDDTLVDWKVDESYDLDIRGCSHGTLKARTPFGALRGMETFFQLLVEDGSSEEVCVPLGLPHDSITITDQPLYPHRALLIDIGRRLFPLSFMRSIIDAMAMAKMNVLQLHLNDFGRIAWESKLFPELNVGYDT
eukprot:g5434.t1